MQNELPKRKNIRLKGYDYSSNGMYFITICCEERKNYFGKICCRRGGALFHPVNDRTEQSPAPRNNAQKC